MTGVGVGGCVACGRWFGRRPGMCWIHAVCAALGLALVLACLGVWLLYISVCGWVCELGLRWVGVESRLVSSPNEADR